NFENRITVCWDETNDVNAGNIERNTKFPDVENFEMIYSGPHIFVGNPLYKTPRERCVLNSDYDIIDISKIDDDFVARPHHGHQNESVGYATYIKGFQRSDCTYHKRVDYYKVALRQLLSQPEKRTLSRAIIPPKSYHLQGVIS